MANRLYDSFSSWESGKGVGKSVTPKSNRLLSGYSDWEKKRKKLADEASAKLALQKTSLEEQPAITPKPVDQVQREYRWTAFNKKEEITTISQAPENKPPLTREQELALDYKKATIGEEAKSAVMEAGAAFSGMGAGIGRAIEVKGKRFGNETIEKAGKATADFYDKNTKWYKEGVLPDLSTMRDSSGKWDKEKIKDPAAWAHQIAQGTGSMLPMIAASPLTGGVAIGGGIMGLAEKGDAVQTYSQIIADRKGVTVEQLSQEDITKIDDMSDVYGVLSAVLESYAPSELIKNIAIKKAASGLLQRIVFETPLAMLKNGLKEGGTEWTQRFAQNVIAKVSGINPEQNIYEGAADEGIAGFATGTLFGTSEGLAKGKPINAKMTFNKETPPDGGTPPDGTPPPDNKPPFESPQKAPKFSKELETFINAIGEGDTEIAMEMQGDISTEQLNNITQGLQTAISQTTNPEVQTRIQSDLAFVKKILSERQPIVEEVTGEAVIEKTNKINEQAPAVRQDVFDTLNRVSQTGHETAVKAKELVDQIKKNNDTIQEELKTIQDTKKELLAQKKAAENSSDKTALQKQIDALDHRKFALQAERNKVSTTEKTRRVSPVPTLENNTDGIVTKVESFGREQFVPFLEKYKGRDIVMAGKDVAVWDAERKTLFRVALDDSKSNGNRVIVESANTVENAKKYIDWLEGVGKKEKPKKVNPKKDITGKEVEEHIKPRIKNALTEKANESVIINKEQYGKADQNTGQRDNTGEVSGALQVGESEQGRVRESGQEDVRVQQGAGRNDAGDNGERVSDRRKLKPTRAEIEKLVNSKEFFTPKEKDILRQYEGSGGQKEGEGRGLLDEYYTPQIVVEKVWKLINQHIDGKITNVVEPSAGIGRFFEGAPKDAVLAAIEINPISAKITKALYPEAVIHNKPFEDIFIDEKGNKRNPKLGYVDVVIGNPPYGEHRGKYKGLGEETRIGRYEEYFIKRALELTRKGGIVAMVVPSGFIRGKQNYAKEQIAKLGELVDAYRLPNKSFGTTDIGTDIVIFKRRPTLTGNDSQKRLTIISRQQTMSNDIFFRDVMNLDKTLGTATTRKGRFGIENYVEGTLEEAMGKLTVDEQVAQEQAIEEFEDEDAANVEMEQELTPEIEQEAVRKTRIAKVKRTRAERTGKDTAIKGVFKRKEKTPHIVVGTKNGKIKLFSQGEKLSPEAQKIAALTTENGSIAPEALNKEQKETLNFYHDNYYNDYNYYQGDIYEKLKSLEISKDKISNAQYKRQKAGLEKILPPALTIDKITILPIDRLAKEIRIAGDKKLIDGFIEWLQDLPYNAFEGSSSWEIGGYLNGSPVRGSDKESNAKEKTRRRVVGNKLFKKYYTEELEEADKKKIEEKFNRTFNSYVKPDYTKYPIEVGLFNKFYGEDFEMREIQMEGAAFLVNKGVGLLAYEVGVGKTLAAIAAISDVMKKGWAKKPLIVVPKNIKSKWLADLTESMPNIVINDLSNLGGKFKYKGKAEDLKIADGTLTIITEDGFKRIGFKDDTYAGLTNNLEDVMYSNEKMSKRQTELQKAKTEEVVGRAMKKTDYPLTFEDFGFDHITIDESHRAKNIFSKAKVKGEKRQSSNEYGAIRSAVSERGLKTYLATQYILSQNAGRNVFLLTATPFNNSPIEIYSMLSLVAKARLEELGIKNINDFISLFCEIETKYAIKANGTVSLTDQVRKFTNLQQLQKLVREYIDFRTGEEAGIPRPKKKKLTPHLKMTSLQAELIEKSQELFSSKYKREGGTLLAISELQKITFSPYLSRYYTGGTPTAKMVVENSPKIRYAVEAIKAAHAVNPSVGQIIFSEKGVELFRPIRDYFIQELGYKKDEVETIDSSTSDAVKDDIQERFQAGEVKILLASGTVKEGVDLQKNSTDLYNLYLQWNPTDMIQAEGRTWRQGSYYDNVRIHYPLIQNSIDPFIFQKLEEKASRIADVFSYKGDSLDVSDIDFEGMKFELITDPTMRLNAKYEYEKAELETKYKIAESEIAFIERRMGNINEIKEDIEDYTKYKKEAREKDDAEDVHYYSEKLEKRKKELEEELLKLKKKGVIVENVAKERQEKISSKEELSRQMEALREKLGKDLESVKKERVQLISGENKFEEILGFMKDEGFYTHEGKVSLGKVPMASFFPDYVAGEVNVREHIRSGKSVSAYTRKAVDTDKIRLKDIQGSEHIKKLMKEELRRGSMTLKEYQMTDRFIDRVDKLLGDVAMDIDEEGVEQGVYLYRDNLIGLFRKNIKKNGGKFGRTFIHEVWHSLTRYLPVKYFNAFEKLYKRDLDALLESDPDFALQLRLAENQGQQQVMRLFSKNMQYYWAYDINEWFAETMTDKTLAELEKDFQVTPYGFVGKIFAHVKAVLKAAVESVQEVLGLDRTTEVFRAFWEGKYERMQLKLGLTGSRYSRVTDRSFMPEEAPEEAKIEPEKPLINEKGQINVLKLYKKVFKEFYEGEPQAMNTLEDEKLLRGMTKRSFTLGKRYATKLTKDNYRQVQKEIRNYIVKNIPVKNRSELLRAVINAKSKADVEIVIKKVDDMVAKGKGREINAAKKNLMKSIYNIFLKRGMLDTSQPKDQPRVNGAMLRQIVKHITKDGRLKMRQMTIPELEQMKVIAETLKQDKLGRIKLLSDIKLGKINDLLPENLRDKEYVTMGDIEESLVNRDIMGSLFGIASVNLARAGRFVMNKNDITKQMYDKFTTAERHYIDQYEEFNKDMADLYQEATGKMTKFRDKKMDAKIIDYLENRIPEGDLTEGELALAKEMISFYADSIEVMKPNRLRKYYFTHTKQNFLESVGAVGFGNAVKEFFNEAFVADMYKSMPPEIAANLEYIVANNVFNPFGLPRKGKRFSQNLRKALESYAHVYYMKKNFDKLYTQSNAVLNILPPNLQTYFKRYLQSAKGRPEGKAYNPTIKKVLEKAVTWEYIKILGLNYASGIFNVAVGLIDNYAALGIFTKDSLVLGNGRYLTPKGYRLIKKYRVASQNVTYEMTQLMHTIPEVANRILFFQMEIGEHYLRGTAFLSLLTSEEYKTGKVTDKRMSEIRNRIGEAQPLYGRFDSPVYGRHALGKTFYMFLSWLPTRIENWINWFSGAAGALKNEKSLADKTINNKDLGKTIRWLSMFIFMSIAFGDRDRWKREVEQYKNLFSLDYWVKLFDPTSKPVWADVINIGLMLKFLVNQEQYKTSGTDYKKGDYKWGIYGKRVITPTVVKRVQQGKNPLTEGWLPQENPAANPYAKYNNANK